MFGAMRTNNFMAIYKPKKVELMTMVKDKQANVNLSTFKLSVLGLFSDIMNEESVDNETTGKLARLRARIEIELKEL